MNREFIHAACIFTAKLMAFGFAQCVSAQCNSADLFGQEQQFSTGMNPWTATVSDLDNDGYPDLAVANISSHSISILMGNGDGTFQTSSNVPSANRPGTVVAGDFNEDGDPDLAVANVDSDILSVFIGLGDGTFQTRQDYGIGKDGRGRFVVTGDINNDGTLDLIATNIFSNTISILIGNGDGTFQPFRQFSTGNTPVCVAVADLNGDSKPDLAVANSGTGSQPDNRLSVFLGNGNGTFQFREDITVGTSPYFVAAGDFDTDGVPDLAVANRGSNSVSVLRGNGDGTFLPSVEFATGSGPRGLAVGDLDTDGLLDLAVTNGDSHTLSVLRGNGDGTFMPRSDFSVGMSPYSVAISDLDIDGKPDIAVANISSNTVSVLLNQCAPPLPCTPDLDSNGILNFFDIAGFLAYFQFLNPIADFNADGLFNFFDVSAFLQAFNAGCP